MSEHKSGQSNWTPEQKKLYTERREHGVRGQIGYANIHQTVEDEKGDAQRIPIGFLRGPGSSSRLQTHRGNSPKGRDGSAKNLATRRKKPWIERIKEAKEYAKQYEGLGIKHGK